MPNKDGTGPQGQDPASGGGRGVRSGSGKDTSRQGGCRKGSGKGAGRGLGKGQGGCKK